MLPVFSLKEQAESLLNATIKICDNFATGLDYRISAYLQS